MIGSLQEVGPATSPRDDIHELILLQSYPVCRPLSRKIHVSLNFYTWSILPAMSSPTEISPPLTYKSAGVDLATGDAMAQRLRFLAQRTHSPRVLANAGPFGGLFRL